MVRCRSTSTAPWSGDCHMSRKRWMGFKLLLMPPFTHILGPAVASGSGKPQTQSIRRLSIIRSLIDQLPPNDYFMQILGDVSIDALAFQDRGFQVLSQVHFRNRLPGRFGQDLDRYKLKDSGNTFVAAKRRSRSRPSTIRTTSSASIAKTSGSKAASASCLSKLFPPCSQRPMPGDVANSSAPIGPTGRPRR